MFIIAIDPGVNSGWAIFDETKKLFNCGLSSPSTFVSKPMIFAQATIEHPAIYPHGRTPNPNDIVKLAVNAGEWAGRLRNEGASIKYVYPREWKGTINPDVCNARVWAALAPEEQNTVDLACKGIAPSKRHNVLDAIGIGLFALNRWRK